jgi:hypothetical protein
MGHAVNVPLRWSIIFLLLLLGSISSGRVLAGPQDLPALEEETPTSGQIPTPAELIAAVNDLRLSRGLLPLNPHPILMRVAQEQAYVLADSEGAAGHARPNGISLTDYLLMLGYPLAGDLSLGGYRAENWTTGGTDVQEVIAAWLGDDLHANTMLRVEYQDIGAGISSSTDEWGVTHYFYVIDAAMPTASGRQQNYTPLGLLTATAFAKYAGTPQWMIPIVLSTARPDGDVIHDVQYGQTLWSLAIHYGTTIEQIKRWNNLQADVILPGQKLLILKGATQPVPTVTPSTLEPVSRALHTPAPQLTVTMTFVEDPPRESGQLLKQNSTIVAALLISFSVLLGAIVGFGKKKT